MNWIGLDPGKSGGLTVMREDGSVLFVKLDCTPADVCYVLESNREPAFAILEEMAVFPGQNPGALANITKLFRHQGILMGILTALKIPFQTVRPSDWQRAMGCRTKGDKKVSYRKAQELFPNLKVTHWNADSLLMAEHGRRVCNQRNGVQAEL